MRLEHRLKRLEADAARPAVVFKVVWDDDPEPPHGPGIRLRWGDDHEPPGEAPETP
jgi:hypothetical protein